MAGETDLETRVAVLELAFKTLKTSQQEPLLALIDWASKESVNELGRTRGVLLALTAFARAASRLAPSAPALAREFEKEIEIAQADTLLLRLPDAALNGANEGIVATADALRRALAEP